MRVKSVSIIFILITVTLAFAPINFSAAAPGGIKINPEDAEKIILDALFYYKPPRVKPLESKRSLNGPQNGFAVIDVTREQGEADAFSADTEMYVGGYGDSLWFRLKKSGKNWKIVEIRFQGMPVSRSEARKRISKFSHLLKVKETMQLMKQIGYAIESYLSDKYRVPAGPSLSKIKPLLVPKYAEDIPLKDAWGNNIRYLYGKGKEKDFYWLGSGGSDGRFRGFRQKGYYETTLNDGKDIVYSNGAFFHRPREIR
jgi:hypothetical protein